MRKSGWGVIRIDESGVDLTTDELFAGALVEVGEDDDERATPCLIALTGRPTREVFDRAARLLACDGYLERELGARILRELGPYDAEGRRPFAEETIGVLMAEMVDEPDPWVLGWMISALGYHRARQALDLVLGHQEHPAQPIRFAVAAALPSLADPERTEPGVVEALLRLAVDEDGAVRWYALYALFNETAGVTAEQRRGWAAHLSGRAGDAERREELSRIAETLDDPSDTALRALLVRAGRL
ncbi:HEAT repeat domain-containing protein [Streptomyces sp. NPDC054956]